MLRLLNWFMKVSLWHPKDNQLYWKLCKRDYDTKSPQARDLNHAVGYSLAKDFKPLYRVEKPGFQCLVSNWTQSINLLSRKYFTETKIPKLHNETKNTTVKPKLSEVVRFLAKTDLWTSRANHPYSVSQCISYLVHGIYKPSHLKPYHC